MWWFNRNMLLWWSWHPWTAQRSESFHMELRGIRENLITSTVRECACVCVCVCNMWEASLGGFSFLRDHSSLLYSCLYIKWFDPVLFKEWFWLDITLCNCDVIGYPCPLRSVLVDRESWQERIPKRGSSFKVDISSLNSRIYCFESWQLNFLPPVRSIFL